MTFRYTSSRGEHIPTFGQILAESVKFKEVQEQLSLYLGKGVPDKEICTLLHISLDYLERFKSKVKYTIPSSPTPESLEIFKNHELEFWDFVKETTGDIYLVSWFSYYEVLSKVSEEINVTIHAVDKRIDTMKIPNYHLEQDYIESAPTSLKVGAGGRGMFLLKPDLIRLLRLSFTKTYPKFVQDYVRENQVNLFRIKVLETDRTTLLPPLIKGQKREPPRKILYVGINLLTDLIKPAYDKRKEEIEKQFSEFKKLPIKDAWEVLDLLKTEKVNSNGHKE
jgi:hypothetical protein